VRRRLQESLTGLGGSAYSDAAFGLSTHRWQVENSALAVPLSLAILDERQRPSPYGTEAPLSSVLFGDGR
jgi:hypothetical protein